MTPVAICIPVRDEMDELPNLFAGIDRLEVDDGGEVNVCLLLDGCVDDSSRLAESYRSSAPQRVWIEQTARMPANAGIARHRAMLLGLRALDHRDGLLLTTDADTVPACDWLRAMVAGLNAADIVVGRIMRNCSPPSALQDRLDAYYDRLFELRRRLDPVPWEASITHHHVGGANIGVRVGAYQALGGFAPVGAGEDARLVDDAARAGLRVRRDAASVVRTSGRRDGRAAGGLASTLRQLDGADAAAIQVAHPADAAWQYRMHSKARRAHARDRLDLLAAALGLTYDHVLGVARDCANGEAFAMSIVPEPPGGVRSVPLPVAERELATLTGVSLAA